MKRILPFLGLLLALPSASWAAQIGSAGENLFSQNSIGAFSAVTVTAQSNGEITAQHGIDLILEPEIRLIWDDSDLALSGSAVENGRISSSAEPSYSINRKTLHLKVAQDFMPGESLLIEGLEARTYDKALGYRFLLLDLNGDGQPEAADGNQYRVKDTVRIDDLAPLPPTGLQATPSSDHSAVQLSWANSPDYDLQSVRIVKSYLRNGISFDEQEAFFGAADSWLDTQAQKGDKISYSLASWDDHQFSPMAGIAVDNFPLPAPAPEKPLEPLPPSEPEPEPSEEPAPSEELDELRQRLPYYSLRYRIACFPGGVAVPEGSSLCLWAKINLSYAERLLETDSPLASFSLREGAIVASRLAFSRQRHQSSCVESPLPADYCLALAKNLMRAEDLLSSFAP